MKIMVETSARHIHVTKEVFATLFGADATLTKKKDLSELNELKKQGIREHVCEILEGGVEAFKKREEKYNI